MAAEFVHNVAGGLRESRWPGIWDGPSPLTIRYEFDNAGRRKSALWSWERSPCDPDRRCGTDNVSVREGRRALVPAVPGSGRAVACDRAARVRRRSGDERRPGGGDSRSGPSNSRCWALGLRSVQIPADLAREEPIDLAVPGNRAHLPCLAIDIDAVVAALAEKLTAVRLEVSDQIPPLHAAGIRRGSRTISPPPSSSATRARLASSTSLTASRRLARASSRVAP
jgi:hypothetical protein